MNHLYLPKKILDVFVAEIVSIFPTSSSKYTEYSFSITENENEAFEITFKRRKNND